MKPKLKLLSYIFIIILVVACEKKSGRFEIINNINNPDLEQIHTKLIRSIPLQFDEEDFTSWTVADEKVYFCNMMQHKITILDFDGNLIKMIDATGKGPGELILPYPIIYDEKNSCIGVFDVGNLRYSYFTYKGDYIKDKMQVSKTPTIPFALKAFGQFTLACNIRMQVKNGKMEKYYTLQIVKPDTSIVLFEVEEDFSKVPKFTCNNEYVYSSSISTDEYRIDVYNANGKKVKEIRKEFQQIKIPHDEIVRIKKDTKDKKGYKIPKFYNAIYDLHIDIRGNLWVGTFNNEGKAYYDIIDQKGKVIKQYKPPKDFITLKIFYSLRLYNDKLIEIIKNPDDTYSMNIYKINI
ncbi:MAG: 6-bladed beta-propeller [Candidatus Cloacimonetes bacterium]|nr:6-bladed beta-propeller [Candidatus Cloacimonadota bacterium]